MKIKIKYDALYVKADKDKTLIKKEDITKYPELVFGVFMLKNILPDYRKEFLDKIINECNVQVMGNVMYLENVHKNNTEKITKLFLQYYEKQNLINKIIGEKMYVIEV